MTGGSFEGFGGIKIFTRAWRPAASPHGVVVISHGFNSHSGQYEWVAAAAGVQGLAVYALDHRGRGRSGGERFFVHSVDEYVDDLKTFVDAVKTREPGLPVFLLGHSAGGVVACVYALENQDELTGLICESFAYQVPAPTSRSPCEGAEPRPAPRARAEAQERALLARSAGGGGDERRPAHRQRIPADADRRGAGARGRAPEEEFKRITLPLLILHGTADKATKPSGSRQFYERAGSDDKMLKLYEGHYHDLLADIGKQRVMADIQAWIDDHLPRTPIRRVEEIRV